MSVDLHQVPAEDREGRKETAGITPCRLTSLSDAGESPGCSSAASFPKAGRRLQAGSQGAADHAHPHLPSFTPIAQIKSWSSEGELKDVHFALADKACESAV